MARILIVDDEPSMQDLLAHILEKRGHVVERYGSGVGVVERHREEPFDLIILDLIMPEKEGLETLMDLRRCNPKAPVLAISGVGAQYLPAARLIGAARTLSKPFEQRDFLDACNALLGANDAE